MNATQLQNIEISNHPTKGLQRRVDLLSFIWNSSDKFISQLYAVYELDLAGNRDLFSRYEVVLPASDAWLVNASTGDLAMTLEDWQVIEDAYNNTLVLYTTAQEKYTTDLASYTDALTIYNASEDPNKVAPVAPMLPVSPVDNRVTGLIGEYTFFLAYAENPIELYPLLLSKVAEADSERHKFDR